MSNNHSRARFDANFPDSLTEAEHCALQAISEHDGIAAAAASLGVTRSTIYTQLQAARYKAGVSSTVRLVVLYLQAHETQGAAA